MINASSMTYLLLLFYPYFQASGYLWMKTYRNIGNAKVTNGGRKLQFLSYRFQDSAVSLLPQRFPCEDTEPNVLPPSPTFRVRMISFVESSSAKALAASRFSCATFSSFAFLELQVIEVLGCSLNTKLFWQDHISCISVTYIYDLSLFPRDFTSSSKNYFHFYLSPS